MPKFNVIVSHSLRREIVVIRLRGFSEQARVNSPVELSEIRENWDEAGNLEFSFIAMGMQISGSLVTSECDVTVYGSLPFAAMPFRGAIETEIESRIKDVIDSGEWQAAHTKIEIVRLKIALVF